MAKFVLLGLAEEDRMLVVDCEGLTVTAVDPSQTSAPDQKDNLAAVTNARRRGLTLIRGVNVAIATTERSETASFPYIASFPYGEAS
jgi:hypothetical protein